MIVGTIKNTVKLQMMDTKWQQKKVNPGRKQSEMTQEERMLQELREQAKDIREGNKYTKISVKIQAGGTLTAEELKYLKENYPQALQDYEEIKREKEAYERQLKNCRTKEEVERVKVQKLGSFMAEAKKISSNPSIPDDRKKALLGKILAKVINVSEVHYEFTKSLRYQNLPTEEEKQAKEDAAETTVMEQQENVQEKNVLKENAQEENLSEKTEITADIDIVAETKTFEQAEEEIKDYLKKQDACSKKIDVTI